MVASTSILSVNCPLATIIPVCWVPYYWPKPNFKRKHSVHLAWHYFPPGDGILNSVEGFESVKQESDVVDAILYEKIGMPRLDLSDDLARPGYVLVKADSHERASARAVELVQRVKFNYDNA